MCAAPTSSRPWWAELGAVVPRSLTFARDAARTAEQGDSAVPPLAGNPVAWATVALDELAMSAAYLHGRRSGEQVTEEAVEATAETVARLSAAGVVDQPLRAHPAPPGPAQVRLTSRRRFGTDFEHVSFDSGFAPATDFPGATPWTSGTANRTAHAYLLRPDDQPRPWVLVLHGHRMGHPRDLRLLGSIRLQRDLDVNVAHLVLPLHGPRGRDGGHPFPGVDPVRNFLGMSQSVWDARSLLAWLRAIGPGPVGLFGVSLGGHVAAMLAGLDDDLACVVAGVPTADLSTMLADTMRTHWGEEAVAASHVLDEPARTLSRLVSPLTFPARPPVERRFLYAAVGDRLVTPGQALALWQHWERPAILWLQGGHIANNVGASRRFVAQSLAASGVAGPSRGAW